VARRRSAAHEGVAKFASVGYSGRRGITPSICGTFVGASDVLRSLAKGAAVVVAAVRTIAALRGEVST